jgi:hypothetical protein
MLAAYYILLGLYFYLRSVRLRQDQPRRASRLFVGFGLSALAGFMTHQVALVYCVPLFLHAAYLAVWQRMYLTLVRDLAVLALAGAVTAEVWYGWLASTLGVQAILRTTPVTQGDTGAVFRLWNIVGWVSSNLRSSVVPDLLLGFRHDDPPIAPTYRGLTELYFSLFTGALTLSLAAFLVWNFLRSLIRWRFTSESWGGTLAQWTAVGLFAVLGTLGAAVLHPGKIPWGIAHSACFPSVVLLIALGWGILSRTSPRWIALVGAGMVTEFLLMFWSHWWFLTHAPEILEDLPGNASYKSATVVFLNDRLGSGQYLFLGGAALVQLTLCLLLVHFLRQWEPATPTKGAGKVELQPGTLAD